MLTLDFAQRLCNAFFGAKKKTYIAVSLDFIGAGGGSRIPTYFRTLDFESSASTNSATPATKERDYNKHWRLCELLNLIFIYLTN